jgi:50S ribosomal protein L16 3-hydroxylase
VSYAVPGGGVGPHFDSYDVFLLQGEGYRRWRIGRQRDLALKAGLPLKILARFRPQREYVLGPGDMLYLPPDVAHDGVALDACTTYSIGFRAPAAQELVTAFLDWLRDRIALPGRYRDPDRALQRTPARIGPDLQAYAKDSLSRVTWSERAIERFLGCYLTEPKPAVAFSPPMHPLSRRSFAARAMRRGLRLDSATQLLYDARHLYVNGDVLERPREARLALRRLADARELPPSAVGRDAVTILYRWYCDGFIHFR